MLYCTWRPSALTTRPQGQVVSSVTVVQICSGVDDVFVLFDCVYQAEGTLKPWPTFNAEVDCERLRKAMKGLG